MTVTPDRPAGLRARAAAPLVGLVTRASSTLARAELRRSSAAGAPLAALAGDARVRATERRAGATRVAGRRLVYLLAGFGGALFAAWLLQRALAAQPDAGALVANLLFGSRAFLLLAAFGLTVAVVAYFVILATDRAYDHRRIARSDWLDARWFELQTLAALRPIPREAKDEVERQIALARAGDVDGSDDIHRGRLLRAVAFVAIPIAMLPFLAVLLLLVATMVLAGSFSVERAAEDVAVVVRGTLTLDPVTAATDARSGTIALTIPSVLALAAAIADPLGAILVQHFLALLAQVASTLLGRVLGVLFAALPVAITAFAWALLAAESIALSAAGAAARERWGHDFAAAWMAAAAPAPPVAPRA